MKIYLKKSITLILALTFCASFLYAEGIEKGKKNAAKQVAGSPTSTMFNINNISTWVYDDGKSDINKAGDSGFMYPKGSGKTVFFQSGPIWGGSMAGYYTIGGSAYRQGLKHGRIRPDGTADVEATGGNKIRIYRVRSDYKDFSTIDEMKLLFASEIKLEGATAEAVYAQYDLDWNQWPAAWGAPFIDKNGDGVYDPTVDVPGMGDPVEDPPCQTIWWVANDLDQATTVYLYGGLPMKVEVQATFWGYKRNGALGNTMFRKYKLINKNTINFDSMYMCMWSDPDVGGGFDDFAGCDTSLSLGFVYNGAPRDDIYADTPPAAGFDFFQGPRIPGLPTDYAQYNGKWVQGYKGLGMTSFFYFSQGVEPDFSDPDQGVYAGVKQWRNMFEGKKSRSGTAYLDYVTGKPTKFPLSGDPILGTGWIDGMLHVKNDRRFGQVSGPFTMNAGDTQEVVVGQLVAGAFPGVGRIAAVGLLKFYDKSAQGAYDNSFKIPPPPPPPAVTVTELNNEIVLQWYNEAAFAKSETFNKQDFKFEGYNIYQAANTNVTLNDIVDGKKLKRIATYDIRNNVAAIVCDDADATSGVLIKKVLAFGTDSGIQRYYDFKSDMLNGIPLYNGSKYYYAVTAYAYNSNPSAIPNVLESSLVITTATPQPNLPGDRLPNGTTDVLTVNHVSGVSSAVVAPVVVDPKKVAAHSYEVYFTDVAGTLTWNMKEGSTVVLAEQKILPNKSTGDIQNTVIDGVQVQVSGPATREIRDAVATKGKNPFDSTASAGIWGVASGVALNEELWKKGLALGKYWFNGTTLVDDNGYHDVIIKFADVNSAGVFSATDPNASKGYRYLRAAGSAPALPEFAPFIKNTSTNYGFQEFGLNGGPNIPLAAFDVKNRKTPCFSTC